MLQELLAAAKGETAPTCWPACRLVGDLDHRAAASVFAHERIERGGVGGMQPDAAMRGGAPEMFDLIGPVDGITAQEEDRVRHR